MAKPTPIITLRNLAQSITEAEEKLAWLRTGAAARVTLAREFAKMTPAQLADAAGIARSHVCEVESHKRPVTVKTLRKLLAALEAQSAK